MKKYIVLILSCIVTMGVITSCGSKTKTENTEDNKTAKTEIKPEPPKKKYVELAEKMNASMPKVWPGGMRMDRAEAVSANEYKYYFTNTKEFAVSPEEFVRSSKPAIAIGLKEKDDEDAKMFRKDKMTVIFAYYKMDGTLFAEVRITPNEYAE
ncbi:hypothetical protein D0T84_07365 [Dysgonomonas sp. 521]|uniref:hypothetical protein n=1 Tax=Dysgonomonas sp. 521 TaxID=2302932 RepID=UPI0013D79760|nr:hypothetical protein [Dysgonomonas sp. 521]NDV94737.1 hypothetical protein [Dysgonomonas sp. 521]